MRFGFEEEAYLEKLLLTVVFGIAQILYEIAGITYDLDQNDLPLAVFLLDESPGLCFSLSCVFFWVQDNGVCTV